MPAPLETVCDTPDVGGIATSICTLAQLHHRTDDLPVVLDVTMQHLEKRIIVRVEILTRTCHPRRYPPFSNLRTRVLIQSIFISQIMTAGTQIYLISSVKGGEIAVAFMIEVKSTRR